MATNFGSKMVKTRSNVSMTSRSTMKLHPVPTRITFSTAASTQPQPVVPAVVHCDKIPKVRSGILAKFGSSMMIKSASLVIKKDEEPQHKANLLTLAAYRGQGYYLHRLDLFRKAKMAYDEAYKVAPENINLLIGRSNVCTDDLNPDQALKDVNEVLARKPRNIRALRSKARAMAAKRQFEHSVLLNYQGLQRRRQPPYFAEGISDGEHCIDQAIGPPAGQILTELLPVIKRNDVDKILEENLVEDVKHVSRIPKPKRIHKVTQQEAHQQRALSRDLAHKYLGPMAEDKFFLENLLTDVRINSANTAGSKEIKRLTELGLQKINARQNILREQKPYYKIKKEEKTESKHETIFRKEKLLNERRLNVRSARQLLANVEECWRCNRLNEMLKIAKRMQSFLDTKTNHTFPNKSNYVDRLYRAVGEGYLNQYRLSYKLSERGNRRRIAFLMGLRVGRATSYDSVEANYPRRFVAPREDIKEKLATVEVCENPAMRCWLYYELSRLMCTVKDYAQSKYYGKRCQNEAKQLKSATWWLNGCFALISGDMQQGNANEVKAQAEEAIQWAKELEKSEELQSFLVKCIELSEDLAATDNIERRARQHRERQILRTVDESVREDIKHLFKRISMMPYGRRFSVVPRGDSFSQKSARRKHLQRNISIIPGDVKPLHKTSSTIPGFQIFDL